MKTFNYQWQLLYFSSPSLSVVQGLIFLIEDDTRVCLLLNR
ncbi:hypothetical protein HanHA300_Chr10g0351681 [Helianthus annuus]|nr:hypothetical protein HanHA300_Chr10g0351681 [Helianthus annuus]KAJ0529052.1 hypothetical protein HanHA89_Chr10g0373361 [Helianthus annuus]